MAVRQRDVFLLSHLLEVLPFASRWGAADSLVCCPFFFNVRQVDFLVGGLEHLVFLHILRITIPIDLYFSEGLKTNQDYGIIANSIV